MRLQFEKIAEPSNSISFTLFISHVIPYAISMDKLFEMYIRSYLKMAGVLSHALEQTLKYDTFRRIVKIFKNTS